MILRRENMHKGKQKRRKKEQLCSTSDFSARILPIQEKNVYEKTLLTSSLQLPETAQATDSDSKQSGMQSLY